MKILVLLLLTLLAAACSPGVPVPGSTSQATAPDLFVAAQQVQSTQVAISSTQEAVQAESRNLSAQLTATAEAPIVHITETAAAYVIASSQTAQALTATAQSSQATSTAEAMMAQATMTAAQTATAGSWTATAVQNAADIDAARKQAEQQAIANNVARDNLQLQRQQWQNKFNAILPGLVLLIVAVVLIIGVSMLVRWQSFRPVPRDARGDAGLLINVVEGTVADVDRSPYALSGTRRADLKLLPPITAAEQKPVTERDQLVDLATRGLPNVPTSNRESRARTAERMIEPSRSPRFELLGDGSMPPAELLNAETLKVIEGDWKEDPHGPQ